MNGSRRQQILEQVGVRAAVRSVRTGSMWPCIRPGDRVRIQRSSASPLPGEIWVAGGGNLRLVHRVLWRDQESVILKGDWNLWVDPQQSRRALFGPVLEIQHNGQWRPANRLRDRILGLALSGVGTTYQASRLVARRLAIATLGEPRARALKSFLFAR